MNDVPKDGTRRRDVIAALAATAGVAGAAGGGGAIAGWRLNESLEDGTPPIGPAREEAFHGEQQPGIDTSPQRHALFAAFDLLSVDRRGKQLSTEQVSRGFRQLMTG